jgi:hypothetical protein
MRRTLVALAALALAMALALPAGAITDGVPDGDGHPYVGLMVAQDAQGNPQWRCSGTLIAPRLFLTAGHCTEAPAAHVEIWFEPGPIDLASGYPAAGTNRCEGVTGYPCTGDVGGRPFTHPQYDPNAFWLHDLGVVVLDEPVSMSAYGKLPRLNQLDRLKPRRSTIFTAVGYGLQKAFPDASSWKEVAIRERMVAYPHLVQINTGFTGDGSLVLSNNANTGGTCFGDSGGPNFFGTTNVIGGVTSFGLNGTCGGTGGVYRVDRSDDLDWLYGTYGELLG